MDLITLVNVIDCAHRGSKVSPKLIEERESIGKCQYHLMYHLKEKCKELSLSICVLGTSSYVQVLTSRGPNVTRVENREQLLKLDETDREFDVYVITGNLEVSKYLDKHVKAGAVVVIDKWRNIHGRFKKLQNKAKYKKHITNAWPDEDNRRAYPETWWKHMMILQM